MKVNKVLVLALAGLILAVIVIGNASATRIYDYQNYVKSKVDVNLAGSWVQAGGNEISPDIARIDPDSYIECPNIWRNEMNSSVGSASLDWMYSSTGTNPTFNGQSPTSVQLNPGTNSLTYYMRAKVDTGLSAGTYYFDQQQSYYVYTYPYNLNAYGPKQLTRKLINLV